MTAEVAILNREAVALAADSAVTIRQRGRQKIFLSANKIFTLSKAHSVGIMIYGNSFFMDVPWETIIKVYRDKMGDKPFDCLKEYGSDFIKFLERNEYLVDKQRKKKYLKDGIYGYFYYLVDEILTKVNKTKLEKCGMDCDKKAIAKLEKEIISCIIDTSFKIWKNATIAPSMPSELGKDLAKTHEKLIKKAIMDVFEKNNIRLSDSEKNKLFEIAINLLLKFPQDLELIDYSGLVIAGYGKKDIFPCVINYRIDLMVGNHLKYLGNPVTEIGKQQNSIILAFAQRDMVHTFMEGIDPKLNELIKAAIYHIIVEYPQIIVKDLALSKKKGEQLIKNLKSNGVELFKKFIRNYDNHRKKDYSDPIVKTVSLLPKHELASMAEALVNLTSYKLKFSPGSETVGGPVDVAIISKGDGFAWIKRKNLSGEVI